MSAQHTPGPWKLLKVAPRDVVTACGEDREFGVASIIQSVPRIEQRANARLIAAAPELLEACEKAVVWLDGWASAEPIVTELRTAIAKATGEAQ